MSRAELGSDGDAQILIRLSSELHAAIKAKAAREERSMAQAIRNALRAWTEEG